MSLSSSVHANTNLPLGENLTAVTGGLSSCTSVRRHWPVAVSQIRINPSVAHDAISVPSQTTSMPPTGSECAGSDRITLADRTSQRKTASS
ncbi:hypothetical protein ATERTT37_004356 [Aspergillus terreus]